MSHPRIILLSILLMVPACSSGPTEHPYKIQTRYAVSDPQFQRTMGALLGPPLIAGNKTTTLRNGDQIFPAMLDAIAHAEKTVTFETYVYWSGVVGEAFAYALAERARAGVHVHVMLDNLGANELDKETLNEMKRGGVEVVEYHPLHFYDISSAQKYNNRTHRKLLVIDGTVGFTGGVGIADEWMGNADAPDHWRDTHYRIEGPAVAQLQAAFCDNWMETTGHVLDGVNYFPELKPAGELSAQVFKSSPDAGSESMELMYLLSLAAAHKNIRLASAYFVPDKLTVQTLIDARKRGVSVQIIVPGPMIDEKIVRRASRARWGDLLRAGVEIHEYQPTMFHCKQMIIDDLWTSIGSANLDNRSFRLNDEANLNVLDHAFALEQIQIFDQDLARSKRIDYPGWKNRPGFEKFVESLSTIFGPLM